MDPTPCVLVGCVGNWFGIVRRTFPLNQQDALDVIPIEMLNAPSDTDLDIHA